MAGVPFPNSKTEAYIKHLLD